MKKIFIYLLLCVSLFAKTINVAVAANMSYAIVQLSKEFTNSHKNIKINTMIGSSGKLTAQIMRNAPFDMFLSANMKYPTKLYQNGFTLTKPKIYAKGKLILLSTKSRDFSQGLNILFNKNIKQIAIANPKTAPYGIATKETLQNKKIYNKLKSKFIYGESIGQTLIFTIKACDIGFVAKSSIYAKSMNKYKQNINYIDIDTNLYNPIKQGVVILKHAKNSDATQQFYNFLFSQKAKKILEQFGYITQ